MRLRDGGDPPLAGLVLVYPVVHTELPTLASAIQDQLVDLPTVFRFPTEVVTSLVENFLGGSLNDASPHAFAALGNLKGLPPALVLVSEYDDLRSSGEAFAEQLRQAGVEVELLCEEGVPHGHLNLPRLAGTTHSLTCISSWLSSQSATRFPSRLTETSPR
jgi:acetyl esterase/lipase